LSPLGEHNDSEEDVAEQIRDGGKYIQTAEVKVNGSAGTSLHLAQKVQGVSPETGSVRQLSSGGEGGPLRVRAI
jgi:hypothetical protein